MNFLNRLKYYLIGVGIGILLVMAIFKDRKLTSWTPGNQVLKEINERGLILSDEMQQRLNCLELDSAMLKAILLSGDVDFKKSDVRHDDEKHYFIDFEDEVIQSAVVTFKDSVTILNQVVSSGCN